MIKIKFCRNKEKSSPVKAYYSIKLKRKNIKMNYSKGLELGGCISRIKSYIFTYAKIIAYSKLGADLSKRLSLRSLFYLKNFLSKNMPQSRRNGRGV